MSGEMFDKLGSIERPDEAHDEPPRAKPAATLSAAAIPAVATDRTLQELFDALLRRADDFHSADLERAFVAAHRKEIGPQAARRRSKLPEGVDLLKGAANQPSEEVMMATIRRMMTAQKRDFSLSALPFLEPPAPGASTLPEADLDATGPQKKTSLVERAKSYVAAAFRKDFPLAANVAFWGFLALFLFLDPQLSLVLFGNGVFFLLAICFVFMPETLADLAADLWRRLTQLTRRDRSTEEEFGN